MCRHLGYVGRPVAVGELLLRGPHSLETQSWAPAEMRNAGTINADGFGAAWWRDSGLGSGRPRRTAVRYRNSDPIWTDPAVGEVLTGAESTAVLAAVRSATPGMAVTREACAPFTAGQWAFSHNGVVPDWRATLPGVLADVNTAVADRRRSLPDDRGSGPAEALPFDSPTILLEAEALTDSAMLWVLIRRLLDLTGPTAPFADAGAVLRLVAAAVLERQPGARLNLLLGDGTTLWATTCYHSLSALVADDYTVLASEPYDSDPRWQPIGDRRLVVADPGNCASTELTEGVSR